MVPALTKNQARLNDYPDLNYPDWNPSGITALHLLLSSWGRQLLNCAFVRTALTGTVCPVQIPGKAPCCRPQERGRQSQASRAGQETEALVPTTCLILVLDMWNRVIVPCDAHVVAEPVGFEPTTGSVISPYPGLNRIRSTCL